MEMSIPLSVSVAKGVIPAQRGVSFYLNVGDELTVIDPQGEQVADLFCFDAEVPTDVLSSGRTIDENDTIHVTKGHKLYSHSGRAMMEITEDTCGIHDFLVTPCSKGMFRGDHPNCQENLERALDRFHFDGSRITTAFNIFMNVPVMGDGSIRISPPISRAGDFVVFKALRPLVVGLTACSDEGTNNGSCKPIHFEISKNDTRA